MILPNDNKELQMLQLWIVNLLCSAKHAICQRLNVTRTALCKPYFFYFLFLLKKKKNEVSDVDLSTQCHVIKMNNTTAIT